VQACGSLPDSNPMKQYGIYEDLINVVLISASASCALPASTVKLTPPALHTCLGAVEGMMAFE
jgi:hypothetical protein